MTRLVRSALMAALVVALSFGVPVLAIAGGQAQLDPARMFDSGAGLFVFTPQKTQSSIVAAALFHLPSPESYAIPKPVAAKTIARVNLTFKHAAAASTIGAASLATAAPLYDEDAPLIAPSIDVALSELPTLGNLTPSPLVRFGAYHAYVPSLDAVSADLIVPVRAGGVRFTGEVSSAIQVLHPNAFRALQVCGTTDQAVPCPYLADSRAQSVTASANFHLRAGSEPLSLQLSGGLERAASGQNIAFPYVPVDADPIFGASHFSALDPQATLLRYPGVTQTISRTVGAKLAVPVSPRVTLGLQFQRQRLQGDYGDQPLPSLSARNDTYLGNVTYQLPFFGSSAITLSARQYQYRDVFSPDYKLTQTRADLNFTVKF